jgi:hypothetical protein
MELSNFRGRQSTTGYCCPSVTQSKPPWGVYEWCSNLAVTDFTISTFFPFLSQTCTFYYYQSSWMVRQMFGIALDIKTL